jgi:hypothetical protein
MVPVLTLVTVAPTGMVKFFALLLPLAKLDVAASNVINAIAVVVSSFFIVVVF